MLCKFVMKKMLKYNTIHMGTGKIILFPCHSLCWICSSGHFVHGCRADNRTIHGTRSRKPVGVVGRISAVAADTERIRFHQFGSEPGSARTVQHCIDAVIDISYEDYYSLKHWVEVVSYGESDCDWTC